MAYSPSRLIDIIEKNKGKKVAAKKIIETNPDLVTILPKLIRDKNKNIKQIENISKIDINTNTLKQIHDRIISIKKNNEYIIKLFPDIELAIQILVSSILSPKKMTDYTLLYKIDKNFSTNPILTSKILEEIKTYINNEYELEDKLPNMLRESLFMSGAYILAIIPESSVDYVINKDILNVSTEEFHKRTDYLVYSLTKPINLINTTTQTVIKEPKTKKEKLLANLTSHNFIRITDNPNIFKLPIIKDKIVKEVIRSSLKSNVSISQESLNRLTYIDIFREKGTTRDIGNIEIIKTLKETPRKTIGKPMVVKLPTESTIPVFIPGHEEEHIGYFVLLDENGKPLSIDITNDEFEELVNIKSNATNSSNVTQKAYNNLILDVVKDIDVTDLFNEYKNIIEYQIYDSISKSIYGTNVKIADKSDIYFIMFSRALKSQKTTLVYIPQELVFYLAFYYNKLGIGKTLLENITILTSLRAILLFSKVMALAKQSIDVTKVNISLDPEDPDPEKTIEQVQDSVLRLRQNFFPLGINNPIDLVNWIQRAGLQFSYENNPRLPDVRIDFENANIQHTVPDSDLDEELRKQTIIALGLPPEVVDNGFNPEFATTVVNNNILLSKRVMIYQKKLLKELTKLIGIFIYNDEKLRTTIKDIIEENIHEITSGLEEEEKVIYNRSKEEFIDYYINKLTENIYLELPKPDNTNLVNLNAEFEIYLEGLEKAIDTVISSDIFSEDISGELNMHIDTIKNIFKNYLLRKWMSDNNYYPEVLEFSNNDTEEVENLLKVINDHLIYTMRNSDKLLNVIQKYKEAVNKDLENIDGEGASESNYESSSEESEEGSKEGGEEDFDITF